MEYIIIIILVLLIISNISNWIYTYNKPHTKIIREFASSSQYSKMNVNYNNIEDIKKNYLKHGDLKKLEDRICKLELKDVKSKFKKNDLVEWDEGFFFISGLMKSDMSPVYYKDIKYGTYLSREIDLDECKWVCKILTSNEDIKLIEEERLFKKVTKSKK